MKKSFLFRTIFAFAALFSVQAEIFNSKLSSDEKQKLETGEVLIRNINSMKDVCVKQNDSSSRILATMKKLDPSFVAEVIQIRPVEGNENLIEEIDSALCKLPIKKLETAF